MRDIIEADDNDDGTPATLTPDDNSDLVLGGDSPAQSFEDLWPDPAHVFPLWQLFLDRVHPITKIIHVPTLQPYLAEATSGSHKIPKNVEVLLYSVFIMAVVSLNPEECLGLLGCSREQALQRYSSGVRLGLRRLGFLKSHDLTTLQALVIYLVGLPVRLRGPTVADMVQISLQGRYNRHAAWVLNGVVIRIAQKMGLHRDGELLGLSPFDTEMVHDFLDHLWEGRTDLAIMQRRRVWWQIILLDAKYALLSGLSHSLLPRSWDTKEPKNVNDVDLFPTATEPFRDREGPTEMVFCLMINKVAKFLVLVPSLEAMIMAPDVDAINQPDSASWEASLRCRDALETLRTELAELLGRICDPKAGSIHQMTLELKENLMRQLDELTTHPSQQPGWGTEIRSLKDNAFQMAVSSLEHSALNNASTKDLGFLWYTKLFLQIDVCLYMVGQLQHGKAGSLVERAWKQVEMVYHYYPELFDLTNKTYSALATFVLKGWVMRHDFFRAKGQMLETPPYVEKLRILVGDDCKAEPSPQANHTFSRTTDFAYPLNGPQQPAAHNEDPAILDPFLEGFLEDAAAVEWDMFGTPVNIAGAANEHLPFGGYGMGPANGW